MTRNPRSPVPHVGTALLVAATVSVAALTAGSPLGVPGDAAGAEPSSAVSDGSIGISEGRHQTEENGDVFAFVVAGDRETFSIAGEDYDLQATVVDGDDDGRIPIRFNTHVAGTSGQVPALTAVDAEDEVRVTVESGLLGVDVGGSQGTRPTSRYRVTVSPGPAGASDGPNETDAAATGAVTVRQRRTGAVRAWRAPAGLNLSGANATALRSLRGTAMTRAHEVSASELLVLELTASGLEGYVARHDWNATAALVGGSGEAASLSVRNEDLALLQEPARFTLTPAEARVVPDFANDTYYVVVDLPSVETPRGPVAPGRHRAAFEVPPGSPIGSVERGAVATEFDVVEPTASFDGADGGRIHLPGTARSRLAGRATLAPGTSLTVAVHREDGRMITRNRSVSVGADGYFEATLDLSDARSGQSVRVRVRRTNGAVIAAMPGVVGSRPSSPLPSETPDDADPATPSSRPTGTTVADSVGDASPPGSSAEDTRATGNGLGIPSVLAALLVILTAYRTLTGSPNR